MPSSPRAAPLPLPVSGPGLVKWTAPAPPAEVGELRGLVRRRNLYGIACPVCGADLATSPAVVELEGPVPSGGRFYGAFCSGGCLSRWHDPEIHGHQWTEDEAREQLERLWSARAPKPRPPERPELPAHTIEAEGHEAK